MSLIYDRALITTWNDLRSLLEILDISIDPRARDGARFHNYFTLYSLSTQNILQTLETHLLNLGTLTNSLLTKTVTQEIGTQ